MNVFGVNLRASIHECFRMHLLALVHSCYDLPKEMKQDRDLLGAGTTCSLQPGYGSETFLETGNNIHNCFTGAELLVGFCFAAVLKNGMVVLLI